MRRCINLIPFGLIFMSLLFFGLAFQGGHFGSKQGLVLSVEAKDKDNDEDKNRHESKKGSTLYIWAGDQARIAPD